MSNGTNSAVDFGPAAPIWRRFDSGRAGVSVRRRKTPRKMTAPEETPRWNGEARMNKLELVDHIATEAELTKVAAAKALDAVLEGIEKTLKKGDEVRLVGFGTFSVRERAAGKGRNPATGKEIKIAASKNARFKPGAALKASLNKKSGKK